MSMATSYSINKYKTDKKFYNQYQYSASFHLNNVQALRSAIQYKQDDEQGMYDRINSTLDYLDRKRNYGGRWENNYRSAEERFQASEKLFELARFYKARQGTVRFIIGSNWASFYTNLRHDIDDLQKLLPERYSYFYVREVEIDRPLNTIRRENSPYKYRTYFRDLLINADQRQMLTKYLDAQKDIKLSPSMQKWMYPKKSKAFFALNFMQRYYFMDYSDPGYPLMLQMILPGSIRKTIEILAK